MMHIREVNFTFEGKGERLLAYGENRRQGSAVHIRRETSEGDSLSLDKFEQTCGAVPGVVNALDVHRLVETAARLGAGMARNFGQVPHMAIFAKHGNPGGAGVAFSNEENGPATAVTKMIWSDPEALFGGFVLVNFPVTEAVASRLSVQQAFGMRRVLDGIIAPSFEPEAQEMLGRSKGLCKMFVNPALGGMGLADALDISIRLKQVRGGLLAYDGDPYVFVIPEEWGRMLSWEDQHDLVLAWAVGSTSNSNTVTLARRGTIIGNGAGQRSRVMAAKLALMYARTYDHDPRDAIAYSDSFFPYPDGPEVLADAGIKVIFATSGSRNDGVVQEACEKRQVQLLRLPDAEARGFYGHC